MFSPGRTRKLLLLKEDFAPGYFRNKSRSVAKLKQEEEKEKKGNGCSKGFWEESWEGTSVQGPPRFTWRSVSFALPAVWQAVLGTLCKFCANLLQLFCTGGEGGGGNRRQLCWGRLSWRVSDPSHRGRQCWPFLGSSTTWTDIAPFDGSQHRGVLAQHGWPEQTKDYWDYST